MDNLVILFTFLSIIIGVGLVASVIGLFVRHRHTSRQH